MKASGNKIMTCGSAKHGGLNFIVTLLQFWRAQSGFLGRGFRKVFRNNWYRQYEVFFIWHNASYPCPCCPNWQADEFAKNERGKHYSSTSRKVMSLLPKDVDHFL